MEELSRFLERAEALIQRVERLLPPEPPEPDFARSIAFRWRRRDGRSVLQPVAHPHGIRLEDLQDIDRQRDLVQQNTLQFVRGLPANNVLLTGARGTGKSSLIKALLNRYAADGLRLIELDKKDLLDLPDVVERLAAQPYRFVLFCDDLSFNADEPGYTTLKAVLDGSVAATPENVLLYATSNRRHLMPEFMRENLETKYLGDEIHPGETVGGKDLAVGAIRTVGLVLPLQSGRVPGHRAPLAAPPGRGRGRRRADAARGPAVGAAARVAQRARGLAFRARLGGPARRAWPS